MNWTRVTLMMAIMGWVTWAQPLLATPPYGHPDQPYDRLPGTLTTTHTPWARPLSGGKLKALFICPYNNSREVVELAQRLDVTYTVIMNAGHSAWAEGYFEGDSATPLQGLTAQTVLDQLARQRLDPAHRYDVIVVAKVSWLVIPQHIRQLILSHVARGTGLVYVSPNRLQPGWNRIDPADDEDAVFSRLFESGADPVTRRQLVGALPLDIMPLIQLNQVKDFRPLPRPRHVWQQTAFTLSTASHGKGRILGLDYLDETISNRTHSSLTPSYQHPLGDHDEVIYDLSHALLTRGILWTTNRLPPASISISVTGTVVADQSPPASEIPISTEIGTVRWRQSTPATVILRSNLARARIVVKTSTSVQPARATITLRHRETRLRDNVSGFPDAATQHETSPLEPGRRILRQDLEPDDGGTSSIPLPELARGTYLVDVQLFDATGSVIDFASQSLRVEAEQRIASVVTNTDRYRRGDKIHGSVSVVNPLSDTERVMISVNDMWGRLVYAAQAPNIQKQETEFEFHIPIDHPMSELWDVHAWIIDDHGVVDRKTRPVPILNNTFDEFLFMLIFSPTPGSSSWKGALHARQLR
ncbi:MAG: hypothetical protein VB858_09900, partial [Planctomycetaceae bacterium]